MQPIETRYKGYRFRSRLEARWAVFFDHCKQNWIYEHEGFTLLSGAYLPDFYFPGLEAYLEVKPRIALPEYCFEFHTGATLPTCDDFPRDLELASELACPSIWAPVAASSFMATPMMCCWGFLMPAAVARFV